MRRMTFSALGISDRLSKELKHQGISSPTQIQEKAIPAVLKGEDIIAKAQTGTGKTLAFVLPILEKINTQDKAVQALIITPTRELAIQITAEIKKITDRLNEAGVLAIYGGQDVERQIKKLGRGIHIAVGTPGRILDHIRRETIDLSKVSTLVLDEADQMLQAGFQKDIEEIIAQTFDSRQTLLFSATITNKVRDLSKQYMTNPKDITVQEKQITVEKITQLVVETNDRAKQAALFRFLDEQRPFLAIIFCRTKIRAGRLFDAMKARKYAAEELHGDLSQAKREKVMKLFREAKIQYLIATDVAARGLDVEGVTHVYNYDMPLDAETYIHRIGRTGRAGDEGVAVTFAAPKDMDDLHTIEKGIALKLPRQKIDIPSSEYTSQPKNKDQVYRPEKAKRGSQSNRGKVPRRPR
ncbi:DEAD/DEAH box helicase [Bacillus sp. V2I10]|uniref:DEAD/DEAH box helicase n=1 Tax=Bacillus sp. V2I10 TaxID=3042276 RepID=UPI00277FE375|nr:DEAD/DEAH box helicase [Bacillus sp. V2I10]MDQ0856947.1 ATP-dependent RNA helicase DeaD [Bacillus sp. V2I10]